MGSIVDRMDPEDRATAEAVWAAIRKAGLTQTEVAQRAGITSTTWQRRMKGDRSFRVAELIRIARSIGIKASDLVDAVSEKAS